ncbi:MAG: methyltransferase domain-containing protein, partial [Mailhella sp.]|nr:methyltransferase domain-containing protein [Mailhella sp.]
RISRHLKILTEAGLLSPRRDGLWVFYTAEHEGPGRSFLSSIVPFLLDEASGRDDLDRASRIIEERTIHTRQFFNEIADDWDEMNREILGDLSLPAAILAELPQDCGTAADLGCGTGEVLEHLRGSCREVIGVDGSPRMLELARRRFGDDTSGISLRIGELAHLPLRDGEADFICVNLVLHHLSRPGTALAEAARVLRPGGRLLVTDFDQHDLESMRTLYGDRWLGFSKDDLAEGLASAGLRLVFHRRVPVKKGLFLHFMTAEKPASL